MVEFTLNLQNKKINAFDVFLSGVHKQLVAGVRRSRDPEDRN